MLESYGREHCSIEINLIIDIRYRLYICRSAKDRNQSTVGLSRDWAAIFRRIDKGVERLLNSVHL